MESDYKQLVRERLLDRETLIRAVFTGAQKGESQPWARVTVRPVELKGALHLQIARFSEKQDFTKNHLDDAPAAVDELLALPFRNIFIESNAGNVQVNISKKGKAVVKESKPAATTADISHDRQKNRLLTAENAAPFLQAVGIMTQDGRIKADMQSKFKQINDFLRLLDETESFSLLAGSPTRTIRIVDFGCGNAYLTFAVYYYLNEILKLDAHVTGVDVKTELIERHQQKAESLGWSRINFHAGEIAGFIPEHTPDIVLALHACDTATDDALAKGIEWRSQLIVAAPCCQHELQTQMARAPLPAQFSSVFEDGIFFERIGDILTDTFRANILRIVGYRTDVTQFIPIEHTAKNLMIRAVKNPSMDNARWREEYKTMKSFWGVTPYLERLLNKEHVELF
jgi:SAM-dependent methyltransferase